MANRRVLRHFTGHSHDVRKSYRNVLSRGARLLQLPVSSGLMLCFSLSGLQCSFTFGLLRILHVSPVHAPYTKRSMFLHGGRGCGLLGVVTIMWQCLPCDMSFRKGGAPQNDCVRHSPAINLYIGLSQNTRAKRTPHELRYRKNFAGRT